MPFSSSGSFILVKHLSFFLLIIVSFSCSVTNPVRYTGVKENSGYSSPFVRILINEPDEVVKFNVEENISVLADGKDIRIDRGQLVISSDGNGIIIEAGEKKIFSKNLVIHPEDFFTYDKKKLTGDIKIISEKNLIYLINTPSIEEYLKGVIPNEMPLGKGMEYYEGLKAFAIIARTFTVKKLSQGSGLYDVRTDVRDQVYGGLSGRKDISDRVVDETRGQIVSYKNQPATVFYFSACGGSTEDVQNVFNTGALPYLQSVEDGYCSISPKAKWTETFSADRIISLLKKSGKINSPDIQLENIQVNTRFKSGRINELEITLNSKSDGEKSVKLYGNNIRFVLLKSNNQTLNSNLFEVERNGSNQYILKGKGWGHGTGLCQWGALGQALKGKKFREILSFYFPGTEIMRYYD